jgi:flagellar protein FliO/FliZ
MSANFANHCHALTGALAGGLAILGPAGAALAEEAAAPTMASGDLSGAIVKTLAALALVLAVLMGLYVLARRFMPGQGAGLAGGGGLRILGRLMLGPKKGLALVEVADRVLVLGLSEQSINLLATIDDPEQVRRLAASRPGFGQALRKAAGQQEEKP